MCEVGKAHTSHQSTNQCCNLPFHNVHRGVAPRQGERTVVRGRHKRPHSSSKRRFQAADLCQTTKIQSTCVRMRVPWCMHITNHAIPQPRAVHGQPLTITNIHTYIADASHRIASPHPHTHAWPCCTRTADPLARWLTFVWLVTYPPTTHALSFSVDRFQRRVGQQESTQVPHRLLSDVFVTVREAHDVAAPLLIKQAAKRLFGKSAHQGQLTLLSLRRRADQCFAVRTDLAQGRNHIRTHRHIEADRQTHCVRTSSSNTTNEHLMMA